MRLLYWSVPLVFAILCGCRAVETDANHILHIGESGVLSHPTRHPVCVALAHRDVHALAEAVETGNDTAIRRFVADGKALEVPDNTRVRVEQESYNEREVRIQEGPYSGKLVWVPYEWLRLPQARHAQS